MKTVPPITLHKSDAKSRNLFIACTVFATMIVIVGWLYTISKFVGAQVQEARATVSDSAQDVRSHLRQTTKDAQPLTERVQTIRRTFTKSLQTIQEVKQSESFILEHIKQQIEANQQDASTQTPPTYAKEDNTR